jgi:hypothetical protein
VGSAIQCDFDILRIEHCEIAPHLANQVDEPPFRVVQEKPRRRPRSTGTTGLEHSAPAVQTLTTPSGAVFQSRERAATHGINAYTAPSPPT